MKIPLLLFLLSLSGLSISQNLALRTGTSTLHSEILKPGFKGSLTVRTDDEDAFRQWLLTNHPDWKFASFGNGLFEIVEMSHKSAWSLTEFKGKLFADRSGRKAQPEALPGEFDNSLNLIPAAHDAFPSVNGSNGKLSVKEKPFDISDIDLRGRADLTGPFDEPYTNHATYMATIAAGAGNTSTFTRGSAWASTVTTADFDRLLPDSDNDIIAKGITVQNHSYGVGVENYYGIEAADYDRQVKTLPNVLHVFSAGNKGDQTPTNGKYAGLAGYANLTGQFKVSKNTLCVGSADGNGNPVALGSRGPAHDGRIKPELIAIGDAGSSEAAAVVSGIALLVQDAWKKKYGNLPPAAMVKAILVNTAVDSYVPEVDYKTGFGYANALQALETVDEGTPGSGSIGQGGLETIPFQIPAGTQEARITLAWTDPPALPFAEQALVNDLDIVLVRMSDGQIFQPWILDSSPAAVQRGDLALRGTDRINNIERITLKNPEPGSYEIRISGYRITDGVQDYHLATKINSGFRWTWPVTGSTALMGKTRNLRWLSFDGSGTGDLAYRFLPDGQWKDIETGISLVRNGVSWSIPDTTASVRFRLSSGSGTYESPDLHLIPEQRLKIGFNCSDSVMLVWKKVANAESYVLERLGDRFLEPYTTAQDTFLILARTADFPEFFSVRPVIGGRPVTESRAVNIMQQGTGCYVIGFYATGYLFENTPDFILNVGTTYGLESVHLERRTESGWKIVSETNDFTTTAISLADPSVEEGFGYYRARLIRTGNRYVTTDEVEILIAPKGEPYLYPNPVQLNREVNIVTRSEEPIVIRIYDEFGRIIKGTEEFGPVKLLKTEDLTQGFYLVRIYDPGGRNFVRRLVVK